MHKFLQNWRHQYSTQLRDSRPNKESGYAFVLSVCALIVLYLVGFDLLGHTFRLIWLSNRPQSNLTHWPGWNGVEYMFVFGDSYSSTSFDIHGTQPSAANPLGNSDRGDPQVYVSNYIEYLTSKYNESLILTYNFAWSGGTIDNRIDESPFGSVDYHEQVTQEFAPNWGINQPYRSWRGNNTLVCLFFGINDILLFKTKPNATDYISLAIQSYSNSTEQLYENGARNFLFINVPAIERSPGTLQGTTAVQTGIAVHKFNLALERFAKAFIVKHPDVAVFFMDAYTLTTKVLDNPKSYLITSKIKNTTDYCKPYKQSPDLKLFDPSCGIPRNEYFWADELHPTSTVHNIVADQIVGVALRDPL